MVWGCLLSGGVFPFWPRGWRDKAGCFKRAGRCAYIVRWCACCVARRRNLVPHGFYGFLGQVLGAPLFGCGGPAKPWGITVFSQPRPLGVHVFLCVGFPRRLSDYWQIVGATFFEGLPTIVRRLWMGVLLGEDGSYGGGGGWGWLALCFRVLVGNLGCGVRRDALEAFGVAAALIGVYGGCEEVWGWPPRSRALSGRLRLPHYWVRVFPPASRAVLG